MKNVIITGGSAGIGLAAAQKFSQEGYQVFNIDIQKPQHTFSNTDFIECDCSQVNQIEAAIQQILKKINQIDVVVSNAGQHFSGRIENTSESDFDRIMNLNFKGSFFLLKSILPIMKKQQQGSIVLISSDQAFVGHAQSAVYGASKAALAQLAKSTALDYAPFHIRVNAVCPGTIDTPLYRQAIHRFHEKTGKDLKIIEKEEAHLQPLNRIGLPGEVAELIFFLGSDQSTFITGSLFPIDGGYTAR